jgi:hypothetical protein
MFVPIHVTAYSGYKGNESPCTFTVDDRRYGIEEVLARWYEPSYACFKVVPTDGKLFVLRYEQGSDQWTVGSEYAGGEFVRKQLVLVDLDHVRKAQRLIASCEHCYPAAASIHFDRILARITGHPDVFDFLMAQIPRCPICDCGVT